MAQSEKLPLLYTWQKEKQANKKQINFKFHLFILPFAHSFTHSFTHSSIHPFIPSSDFIGSFVHLFCPSFIRSFVCSFIGLFFRLKIRRRHIMSNFDLDFLKNKVTWLTLSPLSFPHITAAWTYHIFHIQHTFIDAKSIKITWYIQKVKQYNLLSHTTSQFSQSCQ